LGGFSDIRTFRPAACLRKLKGIGRFGNVDDLRPFRGVIFGRLWWRHDFVGASLLSVRAQQDAYQRLVAT
jgi:hypothetical protein